MSDLPSSPASGGSSQATTPTPPIANSMAVDPARLQSTHAHVSEQARRRVAMLRWCFGLGVVVAAVLFAIPHLVELDISQQIFINTVWWSLVALGGAALLMDWTLRLPAATTSSVASLLATVFPFATLLLFFAATHSGYSRLSLGICAITVWLWLTLGLHRSVRMYTLSLAALEPHVGDFLKAACDAPRSQLSTLQLQLHDATALQNDTLLDGVVIDRFSNKPVELQRLLTQLKLANVRIYSADHIYELLTGRVALGHIEDSFLDDSTGQVLYAVFKRVLDSIGALMLLTVLSPILLITALLIRLESPGAAIFVQPRIGQNGRIFQMYKFRSMRTDVAAAREDGATVEGDARITRLGKFIRKVRLDELPQLINVVRGDMSLIGPRPEWTVTAQQFIDTIAHYPYRHLVKPGITGWAQVNQGHVVNVQDVMIKLEYDLYYVKHLSAPLDLLITIKTIKTILTGFGAK